MVTIATQCDYCKHLKKVENEYDDLKCDAFPKGVPSDISDGRHDHRKPYRGDQGIMFEPDSYSKGFPEWTLEEYYEDVEEQIL